MAVLEDKLDSGPTADPFFLDINLQAITYLINIRDKKKE